MKLGIPTLCRYDLLARLLASAEKGSVKPTEYLLIDNGGSLQASGISLPPNTRVLHSGKNLGVAASWNRFLDDAGKEPIVISNDDVAFGEHTFRDMVDGTKINPFVEGDGWCLFAQTPECTEKVGFYDEHFMPAYYEDSDYDARLHLAAIHRLKPLTGPFIHEGWATTKYLNDASWLRDGRERSRQYFLRKWGADPAPTFDHLYRSPWNGAPPQGFRLRAPAGFEYLHRYDIINRIAERIGAKRYLEIGVSEGDTIRRIKVTERWGVDPSPTPGAIRGSTVFVPTTSQEFLGTEPAPFDLVFIDGDHRAHVIMSEADVPLTEKGIIVFHDASPSTEAQQIIPCAGGEWCGDVWKGIADLRAWGWLISTIDTDYGVAVCIRRGDQGQFSADKRIWPQLAYRSELLGLVDPFAFEDWLKETL
jgi:hypothetical protein